MVSERLWGEVGVSVPMVEPGKEGAREASRRRVSALPEATSSFIMMFHCVVLRSAVQ